MNSRLTLAKQFVTICQAGVANHSLCRQFSVSCHVLHTVSLLSSRKKQVLCDRCSRRNLLHTSASLEAKKMKRKPLRFIKSSAPIVEIHRNMTVKDVARVMNKSTDHVFEVLLYVNGGDKYDRENSVIDRMDVIGDIVKKSGFRFHMVAQNKKEKIKKNKDIERHPPPDPAVLVQRPPVVTIMGHVDHGKTTLLDALRHSNVVAQEFGGITQHIGAFTVTLPSGEAVTFLDTPGHAAFSSMRARGASVTDMIVLVVAADDGVMQQTVESIEHAKREKVPLIVAINKIDRSGINIDAIKQDLVRHGVVLEEMGGDVQAVPISALKKLNLQNLTEAIVTQAEMMNLKGDPSGGIEGTIIEAKTDPGRGKLATVIVQRGTLKKGMLIIAGTAWAKVRAMFDEQGKPVLEAGLSTPVQIIGWKEELPSAGEEVLEATSEHEVRDAVRWRHEQANLKKQKEDSVEIEKKREAHNEVYQTNRKQRLEEGYRYFRRSTGPKPKEAIVFHEGPQLSIVLKGDVDGSMEAILDVLDTYKSEKCRLDLLHYGVGDITDSDVEMAANFNGEIYAFNVKASDSVTKHAESKGVPIVHNNVIYKLFNDITDSLNARLLPAEEEDVIGEANVLQIFNVSEGKKKLQVAGCRCIKGNLEKKHLFKLVRSGEILSSGHLYSLKHFKDEVETVKSGADCGLSFEDKTVIIQPGDSVICYQVREVKDTIEWEPGF